MLPAYSILGRDELMSVVSSATKKTLPDCLASGNNIVATSNKYDLIVKIVLHFIGVLAMEILLPMEHLHTHI